MKKVRILINIVLVIALLFGSYKVISKVLDYKKADKVYDDIKKIKETREKQLVSKAQSNDNYKVGNSEVDDNKEVKPYIHYNKTTLDLSDINKDYRGWINIDGTNIDYPVLQAKDNNYYLKKDINKNYLPSGSIFLDYRNNRFEDSNTVIYGHYMRNNTMFGELKKFKDKKFFDKNNKIYIETPDGKKLEYKIFSVYTTDANYNYIQTSFNSKSDYKQFLNKIKNKSLYNTNVEVSENDKILTLSTCSYEFENARTVIHAKLVK